MDAARIISMGVKIESSRVVMSREMPATSTVMPTGPNCFTSAEGIPAFTVARCPGSFR